MPHVAREIVEAAESPAIVDELPRALESANLAVRLAPRVGRRQPAALVLVDQHLQVTLQLVLELAVHTSARQLLAQPREKHLQSGHDALPSGLRNRSTMEATRPQRSASAASRRRPAGEIA